MNLRLAILAVFLTFAATFGCAAEGEDANGLNDHPFKNLELRHIGPAITSGRISDFAFHPERKHEYYAAIALGMMLSFRGNR